VGRSDGSHGETSGNKIGPNCRTCELSAKDHSHLALAGTAGKVRIHNTEQPRLAALRQTVRGVMRHSRHAPLRHPNRCGLRSRNRRRAVFLVVIRSVKRVRPRECRHRTCGSGFLGYASSSGVSLVPEPPGGATSLSGRARALRALFGCRLLRVRARRAREDAGAPFRRYADARVRDARARVRVRA